MGETPVLSSPRVHDLGAHRFAAGAVSFVGQFFVGDGRNFDMDVDPVEQRSADFPHVALDLRNRAMTFAPRVVAIAAGAGVQRGNEHEIGGKCRAIQGPRNGDRSVFQRLPHHFQRAAVELREFI